MTGVEHEEWSTRRLTSSCGDPEFVLLRLHFVEDDRMPVGQSLRCGDIMLACPATETQFFNGINAGERHRGDL